MTHDTCRARLSPNRRRLLELLERLRYGRIENLIVRDGEPLFDPRPRIVRRVLLGESCRSEPMRRGTLPPKIAELFSFFDDKRHVLVRAIVVQDHLPLHLVVDE